MKLRLGFVSNSSSSSFTTITTKANHDKAIEALGPYVEAVVNAVGGWTTFDGKEVFLSSILSGNIDTFESMTIDFEEDEIPEEYEYPIEAYDAYVEEVEKYKDECLTNQENF